MTDELLASAFRKILSSAEAGEFVDVVGSSLTLDGHWCVGDERYDFTAEEQAAIVAIVSPQVDA